MKIIFGFLVVFALLSKDWRYFLGFVVSITGIITLWNWFWV